ncbi:MAG: hypothetical protein IKQ90_05180 [Ruminococcus sp.]|nr:hypothetical protein [Ruminococcus sp.]
MDMILAVGPMLCAVFLLPFAMVRGYRWYRDRKLMKKMSPEVKKKLLANIGDTSISEGTLRLVRMYIIRQHLLAAAVFEIVFIIALAVCGWDIAFVYVTAGMLLGVTASAVLRLLPLSRRKKLKKVMGFICRKGRYGATVMYYDMKSLKYRMFTAGTVYEKGDNIRLGSFINLVAAEYRWGTHIIRLLIF